MEKYIKIRMILFILVSFIFGIISYEACSQEPEQPPWPPYASKEFTIIKTPKGEDVEAILYTDKPEWVEYLEELAAWKIDLYDWNATWLDSATVNYNCHGYAWYVSEGGSKVWISLYTHPDGPSGEGGNPNLEKFWTGLKSYKTSTDTTESYVKVYYPYSGHSAIATTNPDYIISKWGLMPLFRHLKTDCPYEHLLEYPHYFYILDPNMTGSTSILCNNVQRTFNTNITNMPGATLTWTPGPYITPVSGAGTPEYTVKGSGNGNSYVNFQITTQTEFSWSSSKDFYAGKPVFNSIIGPTQGYTGIPYTFLANPYRNPLSQSEYEWMVVPPYYDYYFMYYYYDLVTIVFNDPYEYYQVIGRAVNSCGPTYWRVKNVAIYDGFFFSVSPNPASDFVTVTISEPASDEITTDQETPSDYKVSILDFKGILYYSGLKSESSFTLPVRNLRNGNYIINISNGKKTKSLQLIIKH